MTGVVLGSGRVSVAAFDLTFSAPKSASVLFALGRRRRRAHGGGRPRPRPSPGRSRIWSSTPSPPPGDRVRRRVVLPTTGAVAAVFTHGVSRNGDPHVHSHVVLANLVHGADGRWSACDRRGIAAHRLAASAVYEAHLRAGLAPPSASGGRGGPGRTAEVAGVGPELLGEFSTRGADIRRHMYETGAPLGPRRPHRLGGDPSRQGAERPLRRPRGPLAAAGRRRRRPPRAPAGPRCRARTGRARRAPLRRGDLPHRPRWGPPPRRRGGIRRGGP